MLVVNQLSFAYQEKLIFAKLNFSLAAGHILYLRGNNGVGKTTLLKLLAGLLNPLEGEIVYQGQNIALAAQEYYRKLCYVGHKAGLSDLLTPRENCYFDLHWQQQDRDLDELFALFKLKALANEPCWHLSAGQKRKLSLLRLWFTKASLWLLDEPLTALDKEGMTLFIAHLEKHLAKGGMVIFTSHQAMPLRHHSYSEYVL